MRRRTRSTNPLPVDSEEIPLSEVFKEIQHRARSLAMLNLTTSSGGDIVNSVNDDLSDDQVSNDPLDNNINGERIKNNLETTRNPLTRPLLSNEPNPPMSFNMEQLQVVVNQMIQKTLQNLIPAVPPPPPSSVPVQVPSISPQVLVNSENDGSTKRVSPVVTPEKFSSKDNFVKWEIKFNSYCRMNRIPENDKLDVLILLLDDSVLQQIYDDPFISSSYQHLSKFLKDNYNGGISIQAASDELELLVGKRVQRPDDLDFISKKIDYYVEVKYPSDNRERKNYEKLQCLAKVLPSIIQNSYFISTKNNLAEGVAIAKKLWIQEIRAEKDRARGFSILHNPGYKQSSRNQKTYQKYPTNQYCSYCKMNNHSNNTCRNSRNKSRNQSNNIEVMENQNNNIQTCEDDLSRDSLQLTDDKEISENSNKIKDMDNENINSNELTIPQNHSFREILKKINNIDNLFGAVVKINGVKIVSLIDTGSNCLILSKSLADKLNLSTDGEANISTYQSVNSATKICSPITIQIQKQSVTITDNIYAANDNFKNDSYDAIIGTNVLKCLIAVIDLQKGKIIMNTNKNLKTSPNVLLPSSYLILNESNPNIDIDSFVNELKTKYPLAYSRHSFDIGPGKLEVNEIETFENKEMIKSPYYSVPIHEKESISKLLQTWIDNGLLEKSSSNNLHPIMLISKTSDKNDWNSKRFIAVLRQINSITKPITYNTPKVQELLQSLQSFDFITKIDLRSAFFQLSLPINSRRLYGIRTPIGNLQFRRLPQGGKVSSALFQKKMEETFHSLRDNCLIYCDDILLFSKGSLDDHKTLIYKFMNIANLFELKVSLEKSVFFATEASFLGFRINTDGIRPDPSSVDSILKRDLPKRKKHCISFLQALNYFRHVIPNFSKTASCLFDLCKGRDANITFNEEQLQSYHTLRQQLMYAPTLHHPIHNTPFIFTTDSSNHTLGAILSQIQQDHEVPLSFYSCKLPRTKRARSPTFLELHVVAKSLQHYKYLLSSASVIIRTDHRPLLHLTNSNCDKKYLELLETINQFNVSFSYIPGSSNHVADWLSRLCNNSTSSVEPTSHALLPISSNETSVNSIRPTRPRGRPRKHFPIGHLLHTSPQRRRGRPRKHVSPLSRKFKTTTSAQHVLNQSPSHPRRRGRPRKFHNSSVDNISKVRTDSVEHTILPHDPVSIPHNNTNIDATTELFLHPQFPTLNLIQLQQDDIKCTTALKTGKYDNFDCFQDSNGLIKVKLNGEHSNELVVIPDKAVEDIFRLSHDFNGHFSFIKTKANINKSCYITGLAKKLSNYLANCHICKMRNVVTSPQGPTKTILPVPIMEELSIDFLGPLKTAGSKQQRYILNVIDTGSRYVFPIPTKTQQHEEIMHHLMNEVFLKYGFPRKLRCDNAQNFKASSLREMLGKLNIDVVYSTPYYSKSNSICERYLRTLQSGINKLINKTGREWDLYIPFLAYAYNSNLIESFNTSPFELMYARPHNTALDLFLRKFNPSLHDREIDIYEMMERAQISRDIANENHLQHRLHANNKKNKKEFRTFQPGDQIYIRKSKRKSKFDNSYEGPYTLVEDLNSKITYRSSSGRLLTASKTNLRI